MFGCYLARLDIFLFACSRASRSLSQRPRNGPTISPIKYEKCSITKRAIPFCARNAISSYVTLSMTGLPLHIS